MSACSGSDDPPLGTLADVAQQRGFTALVAAAPKANWVPTLSSPTASLTVLAPIDTAFSTLVIAVGSAGLVTALATPTPLKTVFAPTNDAFAAIAGTVAGLSVPQLTTVLTYHVLGSQVLSSGPPFGTPVTTLSGQTIRINAGTAPAIATITDTTSTSAQISAVDIRASNGVIHVINKVLLPSLAGNT